MQLGCFLGPDLYMLTLGIYDITYDIAVTSHAIATALQFFTCALNELNCFCSMPHKEEPDIIQLV